MTSRFVSGGTIAGDAGATGTTTASEPPSTSPPRPAQSSERDEDAAKKQSEWEAVQKELEGERKKREELRRANADGGGEKSLYDILQANKAAKQAAFEEQNRLSNQFRSLDDDEVEFLDGILDGQRVEETRLKRETEERLANFRKAQQQSVLAAGPTTEDTEGEGAIDATEWANSTGRKRKRERESVVKGVKRRTSSEVGKEIRADGNVTTTSEKKQQQQRKIPLKADQAAEEEAKNVDGAKKSPAPAPVTAAETKPALGLVDYGSDEDDDD